MSGNGHCLRLRWLKLNSPSGPPLRQLVDSRLERLAGGRGCLHGGHSEIESCVVGICSGGYSVGEDIRCIIYIKQEESWAEDTALGNPRGNGKGLRGGFGK